MEHLLMERNGGYSSENTLCTRCTAPQPTQQLKDGD